LGQLRLGAGDRLGVAQLALLLGRGALAVIGRDLLLGDLAGAQLFEHRVDMFVGRRRAQGAAHPINRLAKLLPWNWNPDAAKLAA
jgi:hypothetical protein